MKKNYRTIEGKIRYSVDAVAMVKSLVSESSGRLLGRLQLDRNGEWLNIEFSGREDLSRKLEDYIARVNYDGSHEAMMATLEFKARRQA